MIVTSKKLRQMFSPIIIVLMVALFFVVLEISIPFTSAFADVYPAYGVYALFYILLSLAYFALSLSLHLLAPCSVPKLFREPPRELYLVMRFSCWVSIVGLFFLIIDRSLYQGVDFINDNFVEIRTRLNNERATGEGVSSIFSVVGNLLQFWYYFAFVFLIYYYEFFSVGQRRKLAILIFVALLTGSYILGGRSLIAVLAVSFVAVMIARGSSGREIYSKLFKVRSLIWMFVSGMLCLIVIMYVFYARASVGGNDSESYLNSFVDHLHGIKTQSYEACSVGISCDLKNYLLLTALYVTHTFWVLSESIQYMPGDAGGSALWGGVLALYAKIGGPVDGNYPYAGLFNSLPGSIYYEYGWLGVAVGASLLGAMLAWMNFLLLRSAGVFKIIFYVALLDTLLVAPVLSSLNVIMFIFVLVSLCAASVIYISIRSMRMSR
ncbi:oligosaccharide repeat unit polymerase [Pseudomonas corrugata]|nr:oligosaccharide repeat unit polymerase [Pseudomonas corrugata]